MSKITISDAEMIKAIVNEISLDPNQLSPNYFTMSVAEQEIEKDLQKQAMDPTSWMLTYVDRPCPVPDTLPGGKSFYPTDSDLQGGGRLIIYRFENMHWEDIDRTLEAFVSFEYEIVEVFLRSK